jgi:hypothetical protein
MSDSMVSPSTDLDLILEDTDRIEGVLRRAVQDALLDHKRAGNPVAVWREGRVAWVGPEEIGVARWTGR